MSINRLWIIGAAVLFGAIVVLGWILGISPRLSEASAATMERVAVEQQNEAYELKLAALKKQFENIGDLQAELNELRQSVPVEAALPAFVGQLNAISVANKVELTSISVTDAQLYDPVLAAPPPVESVADKDATEPSTDSEPVDVESEPAPERAKASDLLSAGNFVAVPVSVQVVGSHASVLNFIDGVQKGDRLALVTAFTTETQDSSSAPAATVSSETDEVDAAPSSASVKATISAYIYVLIEAAEPAAPAE